jgi:hypothetical protein
LQPQINVLLSIAMTTPRQWAARDLALLTRFIAAYDDIRSAAAALGVSRVTLWRWSNGLFHPTDMAMAGLRARLTVLIRERNSETRKIDQK